MIHAQAGRADEIRFKSLNLMNYYQNIQQAGLIYVNQTRAKF